MTNIINIEYENRERVIEDVLKYEIEITNGQYQGLRFHFNKFDPDVDAHKFSLDYSISLIPKKMPGTPKRYENIAAIVIEDFINSILLKKKAE